MTNNKHPERKNQVCKSVVMHHNKRRHWMKPNLFNTLCGQMRWEIEPIKTKTKFRDCKMCKTTARHWGYKLGKRLVRPKVNAIAIGEPGRAKNRIFV